MSRKRPFLLLIAALLVFCAVAVQAAVSGPGIAAEDAKNIMPVSQVKAGMKGYGLTVFRGTKIEKFDVEVIGVLKKINLGRDLILVKMTGGPISARGANVIQGMSGSPVYVDGKMIGAVAYGEGFAKEPIGMLTPIEDMLEALDPALPSRPTGHSSDLVPLSEPLDVSGRSISSVLFSNVTETEPVSPHTMNMVPLGMPIIVSGMSSRGISGLQELLRPYNLRPMAGPGSSTKKEAVDLVPGSAVGIALSTGDIEIIGVGTLTYRRGNKIIALGHPMLGVGAVDAPMTTAYVHEVFPSVLVSSKIASAMEVKGRIFQDRQWSVGGEIGRNAAMIPVKVYIDDQAIKRRRTANIEVINHPLLAARLIGMIVSEAVYELHSTPGDATAKVRFEVEADKVGKIERENIFFDPVAVDMAAIEDLQRVLSLLSNNKFHPCDIKSVNVSVTITNNRDTATLDRVFVDKNRYEPGETIDVGMVLRPYKREPVVRNMQVKIPDHAANGQYTLQIRGGGRAAAPVISVTSGSDEPEGLRIVSSGSDLGSADNVHQLVQKFLEQQKNNEIEAKLLFPTSAVVVSGEKLSGLPAPLASILKSNRATAFRSEREETKTVVPTEFVVGGSKTLQIMVQRRGQIDVKGPQPPTGVPTPPSAPSVEPPQLRQTEESEDSEDESAAIMPLMVEVGAADNFWSRLGSSKPVVSSAAADTKTEPAKEENKEKAPSSPEADAKEEKKPEKPVARQPILWRQGNFAEFSKGITEGTTVTTEDDVRLTPRLHKIGDTEQAYIWSIWPDGAGGVYAGTGPNGQILRFAKNGESTLIHNSTELAVHALLGDPSGAIYAGTSPNGHVLKVKPDGDPEVVFDAEERHIVALARGSNGDLFAAAGDSGTIYKISGGKGEKLAALPDPEILSVTVYEDNLYAGTGPNGVVYKITSNGQISPVYDAAEPYASAVAVGVEGDLYVGTAPKGVVYRIPVKGLPKAVLEKSPGAITALATSSAGVYAATDGQIYLIGEKNMVSTVDTGNSRAQFTSLAVDDSGILHAGAANPGAVYSVDGAAAVGTYESPVHDAKLPSRWGSISWTADIPQGAAITVQTRSGNSAVPGDSWSEWSAAHRNADGEPITSPPARFMQYRAKLTGVGDVTPVLKSVSILYLPANQPPKVTITAPQGRTRWSGKQTVRWSGTDPDKDTLLYDIYYSADGGTSWKALHRGVKGKAEETESDAEKPKAPTVKKPEPKKKAASVDESKVAERLRAEIEAEQAIPREMKDRILAEVPEIAKELVESPAEAEPEELKLEDPDEEEKSEPSKETSYSWDTTKVSDGRYLIKVVASDRASNGDDFLTAEKISDPFIVVNKPPRVVAFQKHLSIREDKSVVLPGYSYQTLAEIAGVEYRVDTGEWTAASADDGIFDSPNEAFTIRTLPLDSGERTIEVKAIDAAGNAATTKVKVKVE